MRKVLFVVAVGSLALLSSCKKCATCTFDDPIKGELVSEDVCQKGKQFKHVMDVYERNEWVCTEK